MKKCGNAFLTIIAIGLMAAMANADTISLVDYWTLDPDGTDSSTVINSVAGRPTAKLKNFGSTNLGGGWSSQAATALSTGSFKFDANQLLYFRLDGRDGYDGVGTDSFSISMWVNPLRLPHSANMQIFGQWEWDESEPLNARISINSQSGKVRIDTTLSGDDTVDTGATVPLTTATEAAPWSHLAFVFENSTIATYLNGDYVSTTTGCKVDYSAIDQRLSFGGNTDTQNIGYYYSGYMDDISVWNTALQPSEIQDLASGVNPATYTGAAVPEPATWCGLMALLLGGWFFQKRRNGR